MITLHESILQALDAAVSRSEWEVADHLVRAMEALCHDDEFDPRLAETYLRLRRPQAR